MNDDIPSPAVVLPVVDVVFQVQLNLIPNRLYPLRVTQSLSICNRKKYMRM